MRRRDLLKHGRAASQPVASANNRDGDASFSVRAGPELCRHL
ncbi:MAG: hypothetical protein ACRDHP_09440 [Ktedonobacterales bacterium]